MIHAFDSATPPTDAQIEAAKYAGITMWNGYLQSKSGVNIYHAWSQDDFDRVRALGVTPIAYCSGLDDPTDCRNLASQWGVHLCLDVEESTRPLGPWTQPWLTESGAGLYGNGNVFAGINAPFFVLAAYPGYIPGLTWLGNPPSIPHGWQYEGTHEFNDIGVDSSNFDDWFGSEQQGAQDMAIIFADGQEGSPTQGQVWVSLSGAFHVNSPPAEGEIIKAMQQPGYIAQLSDGTAQNIIKAGAAPESLGGNIPNFMISGTVSPQ